MMSIAPERQNVQLPGSGSRVSQPRTARYQAADRAKSCTARTGFEFRICTSRLFHALSGGCWVPVVRQEPLRDKVSTSSRWTLNEFVRSGAHVPGKEPFGGNVHTAGRREATRGSCRRGSGGRQNLEQWRA